MSQVFGDRSFRLQLFESRVVLGVVVPKQLILLIILEPDQSRFRVHVIEHQASVHIGLVDVRGERLKSQLYIDLVGLAPLSRDEDTREEIIDHINLFRLDTVDVIFVVNNLVQLDLIFVISNEVVLVLFLSISLRLGVFEVINLDFCRRDYLVDESVREHLSQLLDRHNLLLLLSFPLPLDGSVPRPCLYDHLFGHKEPLNLF